MYIYDLFNVGNTWIFPIPVLNFLGCMQLVLELYRSMDNGNHRRLKTDLEGLVRYTSDLDVSRSIPI